MERLATYSMPPVQWFRNTAIKKMPTQLNPEQREAAIAYLIEHSPEEILPNATNRSESDNWTAQRTIMASALGQKQAAGTVRVG